MVRDGTLWFLLCWHFIPSLSYVHEDVDFKVVLVSDLISEINTPIFSVNGLLIAKKIIISCEVIKNLKDKAVKTSRF